MKRNTFIKSIIGLPLIFSQLSLFGRKPAGKTIFTPEMLSRNNYGLYIINTKAEDVRKNPGYAATVSWKLCYHNNNFVENLKPGIIETNDRKIHIRPFYRYCKVNFLTDGWIYPIGNTDEEVCEYLNNNPYDTFRVMTKEEVIYLLTQRNQGFLP